jgi:FKBP-type peptidyl-prolyl cis-trans isomerase 2
VETGDEVLILFTLKNKLGNRIDNSVMARGNMPLRLLVGKGYLIKGMDEALLGMKIGEVKICDIMPDKSYGEKGIFYKDKKGNKVFVIEPNDTLNVTIELLSLIKR